MNSTGCTTVSATTTLDQTTRSEWDAVVIGAGPSGSLAARQLALAGARTLLVDRKPFPRSKVCGACVNGHAMAVLDSAGLGDLTGSLGAGPLRALQVHCRSRIARIALPGGVAVSRERFDTALVREAVAAGAAFLPGVSGAVCSHEPDGEINRGVALRAPGGLQQPVTIRSRVVLVASGLDHSRHLPSIEFRSRVTTRARVGIAAVVAAPCAFTAGTIFMALGRAGYAGVVRIEDGALNVAAALDPQFIRQSRGSANAVAGLLSEAGLPPLPALSSGVWSGTVPLTRRTRPVAVDRVFLIGDAAGYVEPFTGEGIGWALSTAAAVVPLALSGITKWEPRLARRWEAVYRRLITRRQRLCRLIAAGLRFPRLATGILRALSCSPWLVDPLVTRISGAPARLKASCP